MALFEDILKGGNLATGLAVGVGMAVVAPAVVSILRPVAKSVIKAGLVAYDEGRAALAEVGQQAGEVVAEVRSEMGQKEPAVAAPAGKRTRRG